MVTVPASARAARIGTMCFAETCIFFSRAA
jgi:hypothetical protein